MRIHDIVFWISTFFLIGVALGSLNVNGWLITIIVLGIAGGKITYGFLKKNKKEIILGTLGFFILIGSFYFHIYTAATKEKVALDEKISFEGIIIKEPKQKIKVQELTFKLEPPLKGEITAYLDPYPEYHYGDKLKLEGIIKKSSSSDRLIAGFPKVISKEGGYGNQFKEKLFTFKNKVLNVFRETLSPEESALVAGLTFGEQSEFSERFKEALKGTGTSHIVALSGYNITIVATVVSLLLGYFIKRQKAFYITILVIIGFVVMTGAEASIVRAAIMGIIAMLAMQSGRIYSFRNAIVIAATVMVVVNPKVLLFDAGFQLSFAALLGIVYLKPYIDKLFRKNPETESTLNWKENLTTTLSAQLATMPIVWFTFKAVTPFAFIPNLLVLEAVPFTMALGFITGFVGLWSYHLALILSWPLKLLLEYEIQIINLLSKIL